MRLRFPKPSVKDDSEEIIELLRDRLRQMKLRVPRRPRGAHDRPLDPKVPRDITMLNDEQLGRLHGEFAAMVAYVNGQLGLKSVEAAIARRADKITRARVRLTKEGTVDDKAAETEIDPRVVETGELLLVAESVEVMTKAIYDGYVVGRDLCSRELTRRMNLIQGRQTV